MEEQEKDQAAAYIKLHEDVRKLILDTVVQELQEQPYGMLSSLVQTTAAHHAKSIVDREIQNYRIVYRGGTASY